MSGTEDQYPPMSRIQVSRNPYMSSGEEPAMACTATDAVGCSAGAACAGSAAGPRSETTAAPTMAASLRTRMLDLRVGGTGRARGQADACPPADDTFHAVPYLDDLARRRAVAGSGHGPSPFSTRLTRVTRLPPSGDRSVYDGGRRVDGVAWGASEQQRTHSRPRPVTPNTSTSKSRVQ